MIDYTPGRNIFRTPAALSAPANYLALQIPRAEKLIIGETYTVQFWDVDISNDMRPTNPVVRLYAGGWSICLCALAVDETGHADHLTATFVVPNRSVHTDEYNNLYCNIYNGYYYDYPYNGYYYDYGSSATSKNLTIGKWKLEHGTEATDWRPAPEDDGYNAWIAEGGSEMILARNSITIIKERDVNATWRFYRIASSTTTPSQPTEAQGKAFVNNQTVPSGWSISEPAYDGTSTNSLYTCDLTSFTDGEVSWSTVSKSSSYEAAKQAYNKALNAEGQAQAAQTTADYKRRVFTSEPTAPYDVGDLWVDALTSEETDEGGETITLTTSVIRVCTTPKADGAAFEAGDWQEASTDDATALGVKEDLDKAREDFEAGLQEANDATAALEQATADRMDGQQLQIDQALLTIEDVNNYMKFGGSGETPVLELGNSETGLRMQLSNNRLAFLDADGNPVAYMTTDALFVQQELSFGDFSFYERAASDGNHLTLKWKDSEAS